MKEIIMKKVIFTSALVLTACTFCLAQKAKTPPADEQVANESASKRNTDKGKSKSAAANGNAQLAGTANVQAQLQKTLNVNTAQIGDTVILKTTQAVKQNGQVIVQKGATLIGRVTEVQRRAAGDVTSKIGLVFDQLQNGDLATPITASITSITNVQSAANVGDSMMSDVTGSSRTSGSASSGSSGGLLGGGGGVLGGVGSTVGGVVNTATSTVGGVAGTATQAVGNTTGNVGRTLSGIQISNTASGSANGSSTISSGDKNLRLEKGVTFNLALTSLAGNQ
jgi:hypothetical protein